LGAAEGLAAGPRRGLIFPTSHACTARARARSWGLATAAGRLDRRCAAIVIGPAPRPFSCTTGSRSAGTVRMGVCKARVQRGAAPGVPTRPRPPKTENGHDGYSGKRPKTKRQRQQPRRRSPRSGTLDKHGYGRPRDSLINGNPQGSAGRTERDVLRSCPPSTQNLWVQRRNCTILRAPNPCRSSEP